MTSLSEDHIWEIIKNYMETTGLVSHQLVSYNQFVTHGISEIIKNNGVTISDTYSISFDNVYIPKPFVVEENRTVSDLLPHQARTRELNYDSPVYINVTEHVTDDDGMTSEKVHYRVELCRIPIMLRSELCHLNSMTPAEMTKAFECEYNNGGYFIIRGHERVLIPQLRSSYNKPFVFEQTNNDKYECICEVRSMSESTGHSVVVETMLCKNGRSIHITIPYTKEAFSVGILFKSLGYYKHEEIKKLISLECPDVDKFIRIMLRESYCNDMDGGVEFFKRENGESDWELLSDLQKEEYQRKSVIEKSLMYIGNLSVNPIKPTDVIKYAHQIVGNELFPHLGISSTNQDKAIFVGYMVRKLLATKLKLRSYDDRDNYVNKRVDSTGILCYDLFKQLFKKFKENLISSLEKVKQSHIEILHCINKNNIITNGLKHCFSTGNWGVPKTSYIRAGVSQILSRLSFGATLSHLRRFCIPIGKEVKNSKIRQIDPSQIMFICPCETPEGQPVGIVMNFSLLTKISERTPSCIVEDVVKRNKFINSECLGAKVFVNGKTIGFTKFVNEFIDEFKSVRSDNAIPYDVSIGYDDIDDEINICSDAGRLIRPVLTLNGSKLKLTVDDGTNWDDLVSRGLIQYVDNSEVSNSVIAFSEEEINKYHNDFCEISPAMLLGVMGSIIPFPDHSQSPRNCYQTSMGKQAMSMYSLSYQHRTDTIAHVLGYPQRPLVSTRAANLMGFNDMPSGVNCIVAIACYSGFNQEDSQIINHSAIQRGLFYATTYRTLSDQETKHGSYSFERVGLPPLNKRKIDINYGLLGKDGIVMSRFPNGKAVYVQKGDALIGKYLVDTKGERDEMVADCSLIVKKEEEGYIDRVIVSTTPDGYKLVRVVIRTERIPEVGDKFASRSAQKGTCGMVYRQENMPFTQDGIVPDIIINPHCIPSRMTINQLMESVLGKSCCVEGTFGDATPFGSSSVDISQVLCDRLGMNGFDGCGKEMMYNGFTGEAMGEVFIGPVYYQRLKHLVSEKIHARATGPVTTLTRQPLEGRSRDGGLRFGEMERDCMIAHGNSMFLKERLCDQSDPYKVPICNQCGNISTTKTNCEICDCDSISMVGMPYISKLVLQELNAMCIKTSIKCN